MPFIWDDFEWKKVDDEDPYDKNRFVVVRKLRVKPNTLPFYQLPILGISIDKIRQRIEHFGEIESIEILDKDEPEAYVTFVSDHAAYSMQSQHDVDKSAGRMQPFQIQPADTWEQPRENINSSSEQNLEQTSEIFMLNEDCLRHLFKFLDVVSLVDLADVCKLFNRLLHQHCFPRIRKFEVKNECYDFVNPRSFAMPLAKMRQILQCIGPYITDLFFECNVYGGNSILKHDVVTRFLEVLVENVGTNIRRARIDCWNICKNGRITKLTPIFRHLELLKLDAGNIPAVLRANLSAYKERDVDIDFQSMCPNLVDLEVNIAVPMKNCGKPWPSLRRILWNNSMYKTALIALIKRNPQLTCIDFVDDPNKSITLAVSKLFSLEKLIISYIDYYRENVIGINIDCLSRLQHLTEISLICLDSVLLTTALDSLATFVGLQKIYLEKVPNGKDEMDVVVIPNYLQSLIKLAQKQSRLEYFKLSYVTVTESCLMDFVRFASQLKKLNLAYCGLKFSDELILNLVDVLKCNRPQPNHALILELYSFECNALTAINSESISCYLQIRLISYIQSIRSPMSLDN